MRVKIVGTGRYLPPRVETAAELAPRIGKTEDWIVSRTGVLRRHVSDIPMAEMGAKAALDALGDGPEPDLVINASGVPNQVIPDSSVFIQEALGYAGIPSFSVHATCMSFAVALHTAASLVSAGAYKRVLIVSSDQGTFGRNFDEPESASLFGDGAAAAVLEPTPEGEASELAAFKMTTWPAGAKLTEVRGGGTRCHPNDPATTREDNLFHMDGPGVYKAAVRRGTGVIKNIFEELGMEREDVALVVPHQSSGPGVAAIARYGFPPEKIVSTVHEEGNCVAASLPLALSLANQQGRIKRGDWVLLCGTGAGLSVVAMMLRW